MENTGSNSRFGSFKKLTLSNHIFLNILIILIIILLIVYFFVRIGLDYKNQGTSSPFLIEGTRQAHISKKIKGDLIRPSTDKKYGIELSYIFWIYIDGTTFNSGKKWKHVFHKGNESSIPLQAPGVWIYPDENKLGINMNTFSTVKSSCDIGNIPMNKWVCVCISLIGDTMDVYVNAKLKKRCKLSGIPKQNYGDLYITKWGGFNGFLSNFRYFNYALPFFRIEQIFKEGPSQAPCTETGVTPPYLAPNYWMTTGFPNTQVSV